MYETEEERKIYCKKLKQRKCVLQAELQQDIFKRNVWIVVAIVVTALCIIGSKLYEAYCGWTLDANTFMLGWRCLITPMIFGSIIALACGYDEQAKELQARGVRLPLKKPKH